MSSSEPERTKEILEQGSAANTRVHSKGKNKRLALHGRGKLEIWMIRARRPDGAETGKANDQMENFTYASNNTMPTRHEGSRESSERQGSTRANAPTEGIQEVMGGHGRQP